MSKLLLAVFLFSCMACTTPARVGVAESEWKSIPRDAAQTCVAQCERIGLRMSAVAMMANNIGCICGPDEPASAQQGGATSAGMATIMLQEQAAAAQDRRRRQRQQN